MNLFNRRKKEMTSIKESLSLINAYSPAFTSYKGGLYEMELTRSAIHALANHTSKLNPVIKGNAYKELGKILKHSFNDISTTTQFLYRLRTIYEVENNAYIIPLYDVYGRINGFHAVSTVNSSIKESGGQWYLIYQMSGKKYAIEYDRVGHLKKMQYKDEIFGTSNSVLSNTMDLINVQNQGIQNGIKSSAFIRFIGRLGQVFKPDDLVKERNRLAQENLSLDNKSGIMLLDNKYSEFKQIESKPFLIDAEQVKLIQDNVSNYFGVSINIMQNKATEDEWNTFYEGAIEPFAVQLSQVLTKLLYTSKEIAYGNEIIFESNRMQFASANTKLNVATQLLDRGVMTINQALAIFNMPEVENGDERVIRGEYINVKDVEKGVNGNGQKDDGKDE